MALLSAIQVRGARELGARLERVRDLLDGPAAERIMRGVAQIASREVKLTTTGGKPLNVRSGRLRASWAPGGAENVLEASRRHALIGSAVVYAAIHEYGGTIRPRRGAWLRFKGRDGWATVASVKMPARRYVSKAKEAAAPKVEAWVAKQIDRAVGGQ